MPTAARSPPPVSPLPTHPSLRNTYTYDQWQYMYYNDLGQLVASVAPNGVNTGSTAAPGFVTRYRYDHLGRTIEVSSPDEGTSQFVYSTDGNLRFSQNQVQREARSSAVLVYQLRFFRSCYRSR